MLRLSHLQAGAAVNVKDGNIAIVLGLALDEPIRDIPMSTVNVATSLQGGNWRTLGMVDIHLTLADENSFAHDYTILHVDEDVFDDVIVSTTIDKSGEWDRIDWDYFADTFNTHILGATFDCPSFKSVSPGYFGGMVNYTSTLSLLREVSGVLESSASSQVLQLRRALPKSYPFQLLPHDNLGSAYPKVHYSGSVSRQILNELCTAFPNYSSFNGVYIPQLVSFESYCAFFDTDDTTIGGPRRGTTGARFQLNEHIAPILVAQGRASPSTVGTRFQSTIDERMVVQVEQLFLPILQDANIAEAIAIFLEVDMSSVSDVNHPLRKSLMIANAFGLNPSSSLDVMSLLDLLNPRSNILASDIITYIAHKIASSLRNSLQHTISLRVPGHHRRAVIYDGDEFQIRGLDTFVAPRSFHLNQVEGVSLSTGFEYIAPNLLTAEFVAKVELNHILELESEVQPLLEFTREELAHAISDRVTPMFTDYLTEVNRSATVATNFVESSEMLKFTNRLLEGSSVIYRTSFLYKDAWTDGSDIDVQTTSSLIAVVDEKTFNMSLSFSDLQLFSLRSDFLYECHANYTSKSQMATEFSENVNAWIIMGMAIQESTEIYPVLLGVRSRPSDTPFFLESYRDAIVTTLLPDLLSLSKSVDLTAQVPSSAYAVLYPQSLFECAVKSTEALIRNNSTVDVEFAYVTLTDWVREVNRDCDGAAVVSGEYVPLPDEGKLEILFEAISARDVSLPKFAELIGGQLKERLASPVRWPLLTENDDAVVNIESTVDVVGAFGLIFIQRMPTEFSTDGFNGDPFLEIRKIDGSLAALITPLMGRESFGLEGFEVEGGLLEAELTVTLQESVHFTVIDGSLNPDGSLASEVMSTIPISYNVAKLYLWLRLSMADGLFVNYIVDTDNFLAMSAEDHHLQLDLCGFEDELSHLLNQVNDAFFNETAFSLSPLMIPTVGGATIVLDVPSAFDLITEGMSQYQESSSGTGFEGMFSLLGNGNLADPCAAMANTSYDSANDARLGLQAYDEYISRTLGDVVGTFGVASVSRSEDFKLQTAEMHFTLFFSANMTGQDSVEADVQNVLKAFIPGLAEMGLSEDFETVIDSIDIGNISTASVGFQIDFTIGIGLRVARELARETWGEYWTSITELEVMERPSPLNNSVFLPALYLNIQDASVRYGVYVDSLSATGNSSEITQGSVQIGVVLDVTSEADRLPIQNRMFSETANAICEIDAELMLLVPVGSGKAAPVLHLTSGTGIEPILRHDFDMNTFLGTVDRDFIDWLDMVEEPYVHPTGLHTFNPVFGYAFIPSGGSLPVGPIFRGLAVYGRLIEYWSDLGALRDSLLQSIPPPIRPVFYLYKMGAFPPVPGFCPELSFGFNEWACGYIKSQVESPELNCVDFNLCNSFDLWLRAVDVEIESDIFDIDMFFDSLDMTSLRTAMEGIFPDADEKSLETLARLTGFEENILEMVRTFDQDLTLGTILKFIQVRAHEDLPGLLPTGTTASAEIDIRLENGGLSMVGFDTVFFAEVDLDYTIMGQAFEYTVNLFLGSEELNTHSELDGKDMKFEQLWVQQEDVATDGKLLIRTHYEIDLTTLTETYIINEFRIDIDIGIRDWQMSTPDMKASEGLVEAVISAELATFSLLNTYYYGDLEIPFELSLNSFAKEGALSLQLPVVRTVTSEETYAADITYQDDDIFDFESSEIDVVAGTVITGDTFAVLKDVLNLLQTIGDGINGVSLFNEEMPGLQRNFHQLVLNDLYSHSGTGEVARGFRPNVSRRNTGAKLDNETDIFDVKIGDLLNVSWIVENRTEISMTEFTSAVKEHITTMLPPSKGGPPLVGSNDTGVGLYCAPNNKRPVTIYGTNSSDGYQLQVCISSIYRTDFKVAFDELLELSKLDDLPIEVDLFMSPRLSVGFQWGFLLTINSTGFRIESTDVDASVVLAASPVEATVRVGPLSLALDGGFRLAARAVLAFKPYTNMRGGMSLREKSLGVQLGGVVTPLVSGYSLGIDAEFLYSDEDVFDAIPAEVIVPDGLGDLSQLSPATLLEMLSTIDSMIRAATENDALKELSIPFLDSVLAKALKVSTFLENLKFRHFMMPTPFERQGTKSRIIRGDPVNSFSPLGDGGGDLYLMMLENITGYNPGDTATLLGSEDFAEQIYLFTESEIRALDGGPGWNSSFFTLLQSKGFSVCDLDDCDEDDDGTFFCSADCMLVLFENLETGQTILATAGFVGNEEDGWESLTYDYFGFVPVDLSDDAPPYLYGFQSEVDIVGMIPTFDDGTTFAQQLNLALADLSSSTYAPNVTCYYEDENALAFMCNLDFVILLPSVSSDLSLGMEISQLGDLASANLDGSVELLPSLGFSITVGIVCEPEKGEQVVLMQDFYNDNENSVEVEVQIRFTKAPQYEECNDAYNFTMDSNADVDEVAAMITSKVNSLYDGCLQDDVAVIEEVSVLRSSSGMGELLIIRMSAGVVSFSFFPVDEENDWGFASMTQSIGNWRFRIGETKLSAEVEFNFVVEDLRASLWDAITVDDAPNSTMATMKAALNLYINPSDYLPLKKWFNLVANLRSSPKTFFLAEVEFSAAMVGAFNASVNGFGDVILPFEVGFDRFVIDLRSVELRTPAISVDIDASSLKFDLSFLKNMRLVDILRVMLGATEMVFGNVTMIKNEGQCSGGIVSSDVMNYRIPLIGTRPCQFLQGPVYVVASLYSLLENEPEGPLDLLEDYLTDLLNDAIKESLGVANVTIDFYNLDDRYQLDAGVSIEWSFDYRNQVDIDLEQILSSTKKLDKYKDILTQVLAFEGEAEFDTEVTIRLSLGFGLEYLKKQKMVRPYLKGDTGISIGFKLFGDFEFDASILNIDSHVAASLLLDNFGQQFKVYAGLNPKKQYVLGVRGAPLLDDQIGVSGFKALAKSFGIGIAGRLKSRITVYIPFKGLSYDSDLIISIPDLSPLLVKKAPQVNVIPMIRLPFLGVLSPLDLLLQNPRTLLQGIETILKQVERYTVAKGGVCETFTAPLVGKSASRSMGFGTQNNFLTKFRIKAINFLRGRLDSYKGEARTVLDVLAYELTNLLHMSRLMRESQSIQVFYFDEAGQIIEGKINDTSLVESFVMAMPLGNTLHIRGDFEFGLPKELEHFPLSLAASGYADIYLDMQMRIGIGFSRGLDGFYLQTDFNEDIYNGTNLQGSSPDVFMDFDLQGMDAAGKLLVFGVDAYDTDIAIVSGLSVQISKKNAGLGSDSDLYPARIPIKKIKEVKEKSKLFIAQLAASADLYIPKLRVKFNVPESTSRNFPELELFVDFKGCINIDLTNSGSGSEMGTRMIQQVPAEISHYDRTIAHFAEVDRPIRDTLISYLQREKMKEVCEGEPGEPQGDIHARVHIDLQNFKAFLKDSIGKIITMMDKVMDPAVKVLRESIPGLKKIIKNELSIMDIARMVAKLRVPGVSQGIRAVEIFIETYEQLSYYYDLINTAPNGVVFIGECKLSTNATCPDCGCEGISLLDSLFGERVRPIQTSAALEIPLIKDPMLLMGLITGNDFDLIRFRARFDLNINFRKTYTILKAPKIQVSFWLELMARAEIILAVNSNGIRRAIFSYDPGALQDILVVRTREKNVKVPLFRWDGSVGFSLIFKAGKLISASLSGGLDINGVVELYDRNWPASEGMVFVSDLVMTSPQKWFEIHFDMCFGFQIKVKVLGIINIKKSFDKCLTVLDYEPSFEFRSVRFEGNGILVVTRSGTNCGKYRDQIYRCIEGNSYPQNRKLFKDVKQLRYDVPGRKRASGENAVVASSTTATAMNVGEFSTNILDGAYLWDGTTEMVLTHAYMRFGESTTQYYNVPRREIRLPVPQLDTLDTVVRDLQGETYIVDGYTYTVRVMCAGSYGVVQLKQAEGFSRLVLDWQGSDSSASVYMYSDRIDIHGSEGTLQIQFAAQYRDVEMLLGDANDHVAIFNARSSLSSIAVYGNAGDDTLIIGEDGSGMDFSVREGIIQFDGGMGHDTFTVNDKDSATPKMDFVVSEGSLKLDRAGYLDVAFGNVESLEIYLSDLGNYLDFVTSTPEQVTEIWGGHGVDLLDVKMPRGEVKGYLGSGNDDVQVYGAAANLWFEGEDGDDSIHIYSRSEDSLNTIVNVVIHWNGGANHDLLEVYMANFGDFEVVLHGDMAGFNRLVMHGTRLPDSLLFREGYIANIHLDMSMERYTIANNQDLTNILTYLYEGKNRAVFDDTRGAVEVHGGSSRDLFQIGQLYTEFLSSNAMVTQEGSLSRGCNPRFPITVFTEGGLDQVTLLHSDCIPTVVAGPGNLLVDMFNYQSPDSSLEFGLRTGSLLNSAFLLLGSESAVATSLMINGTNGDDIVIVTPHDIFVAGQHSSLEQVSELRVHLGPGSDRVYIVGLPSHVSLILDGGLGSDLFELGPMRSRRLIPMVIAELWIIL